MSQSTLHGLKLELTRIYEREGKPEEMVALYRHESQDLHCDLKVFLTAEFQRAAKLAQAVTCTEPDFDNTGFLAGNIDHS